MAKEIMEKECEICGAKFQTSNRLRKYCKDCQEHTGRNKREGERGIRHIAELTHQPNLVEVDCEECGKHFTTIPKLFIEFETKDEVKHIFCSSKCRDSFIRYHGTCCHCGKQFDGDFLFIAGGQLYGRYCSEKCYEAQRERYIKENWAKCKCEYCGKEFYKQKPQRFCDKACYDAAVKNGWRAARSPKAEPVDLVSVRTRCKVCGKQFIQKVRLNSLELTRDYTCSKECFDVYCKQNREKAKMKKEEKKKEEREALERASFSLCATCKISYKECSYMESNYVVLPAGAHMDSEGKIVKCPLHR